MYICLPDAYATDAIFPMYIPNAYAADVDLRPSVISNRRAFSSFTDLMHMRQIHCNRLIDAQPMRYLAI